MGGLDMLSSASEPREFFEEVLVEIAAERGGDFGELSTVPLVVSFVVVESFGDVGERWTVRFHDGGADVEAGEMDEAPLLTVICRRCDWPVFQDRLAEALEAAEDWGLDHLDDPIGVREVGWLRALEGCVTCRATDVEIDGDRRDLAVQVLLNHYSYSGDRRVTVSMRASDAEALADGELTPGRAMADAKLSLQGDVALAMQLGAVLKRMM